MRILPLLLIALLLTPGVLAVKIGTVDTSVVLDNMWNYYFPQTTATISENGGGFFQAAVSEPGQLTSSVIDDIAAQFNNKENDENQNIEVDAAKKNLENSKDNVERMFFYIVATFTVMIDMLLSIIYIAMLSLTIWIVFVGYAKLLILVIDMVTNKMKSRGYK